MRALPAAEGCLDHSQECSATATAVTCLSIHLREGLGDPGGYVEIVEAPPRTSGKSKKRSSLTSMSGIQDLLDVLPRMLRTAWSFVRRMILLSSSGRSIDRVVSDTWIETVWWVQRRPRATF